MNTSLDTDTVSYFMLVLKRYEEDESMPHFEEILNYFNLMQNGAKMEDTQLDLLLPIKEIIKQS